jgi:hypothetical protein
MSQFKLEPLVNVNPRQGCIGFSSSQPSAVKAGAGIVPVALPKPRESQLVCEPPDLRRDKLRSIIPPWAAGAQILN